MILPHESWEFQRASGAEVSRVSSSASPPSPESAGTWAATYGGSSRRESITPWCLLGELHLCMALARFALHTSGEAKMGIRHHVFFCPICAYVANNPTTFLDHIVVGHYWGSFSCGVCLAFATLTAEEMKAHLLGCGQYGDERSKA